MSKSGTSRVDTKQRFQTNLSIAIIDSDNYSDENTILVQIVRNNSYIRETIFDNVEKKVIDDTFFCIAPLKKGTLNYCKRKRPWAHAQSSKIKNFLSGPRLLSNSRVLSNYCYKKTICKNIIDFVVICCDFVCLNDRTILILFDTSGTVV